MTAFPSEIEQALLDVRKAYRLLHNYQRLALDAASYIGAQLGFEYLGGWPKFSGVSPREGKGKLDDWAWNWLNMLLYEFHFGGELADGTPVKFSMLLISDTGYYFSKHGVVDPCDVTKFLAPEQSSTQVGFLLCVKDWPAPEFISEDDAAMKTFIETGGSVPEDYRQRGLIGKCCNFSRLLDEKSTSAFLDEFIAEVNAAGVPVLRVSKA